uniref:Peptidase S1 domain-containing protein n=2 Tax=Clytia hemisphaerica TaxID=252671 RepID=A0A7M5XIM0_9CNID
MHPSFRRDENNTPISDIALIQLSSKLNMNDRVVRACLPQQGVYPTIGKRCYITGWGDLSFEGSSPARLQQAKLPVIRSDGETVDVGYNSPREGVSNACQGDSGGPLSCQRDDGTWQVEGAASYVLNRCQYLSAYAPLNKYLSWVKRYVPGL